MSALLRILDQAKAWSEIPLENRLTTDDEIESALVPYRTSIHSLRDRVKTEVVVKPSTLSEALRRWLDGPGTLSDFSIREVRALCHDSFIATSPAFVRAISARDELPVRRAWLEGMIAQYFAIWREMPEPEPLERLLVDAVRRCARPSRRISLCRNSPEDLFSPKTAARLAAKALEQYESPTDALGRWAIAPSSGLGKATIRCAVVGWAEQIEQMGARLSGPAALAQFEYCLRSLIESEFVGSAEAGRAMSAIVLCPASDLFEPLRSRIRSFILDSRRFGDPRLPANERNWIHCSREARQKVASWFSRQDLDFFFRVALPEREDPHGRRAFWERYLPELVDCLVLLSPSDDRRLRASLNHNLNYGFADGTDDVSAFVMRFRGAAELLIVEFSRPNNAIHIHDAETFERIRGGLRSKQRFSIDELKSPRSRKGTQSHNSNWQGKVGDLLRKLGIRPL